jgi:hypothetical protein
VNGSACLANSRTGWSPVRSIACCDNHNVRTRRRVVYGLIALIAAASLTLVSLALGEPGLRKKTVSCSERIYFANWRSYRPPTSYRNILGRVALRPEGDTYFVHGDFDDTLLDFSKFGMVIRSAKGSVYLSVPAAWRGRFAIGWGSKPKGQFDSIRFRSCPRPPAWTVWAGGVYVLRPACVPLEIRVGTRSRRVWLGVGKQCP